MTHKLPDDIDTTDTLNNFVFVEYAEIDGLQMIHKFLKDGADVHIENDSALRRAATNGHLEVVCALLKYGANVHALDDESLCLSAIGGKYDLPRLKNQIDRTNDSTHESAHESARESIRESTKSIVERVESVTRVDFAIYHNDQIRDRSTLDLMDLYTPRKRPTPDDYLGIVTILLEYGANINAQNDYALRASVANSNIKIMTKLLEHGANIYANECSLLVNLQQDFNEEIADVLLPYCCEQDYGYFPDVYIAARIIPTKNSRATR